MNDVGHTVCAVVGWYLIALLASNVLFMLYRDQRAGTNNHFAAKPLEFHSPDDAPRTFKHSGILDSKLGTFLLYNWTAFFVAGCVWVWPRKPMIETSGGLKRARKTCMRTLKGVNSVVAPRHRHRRQREGMRLCASPLGRNLSNYDSILVGHPSLKVV